MKVEFVNLHNLVLLFFIYSCTIIYSQNIDSLVYNLGPEIQVCEPNNGGDLQCEPSVAISKNVILVSWNDSYGGKINSKTGSAVGWAISYNNGRDFNFGGYLPKIDKKNIWRRKSKGDSQRRVKAIFLKSIKKTFGELMALTLGLELIQMVIFIFRY